MVPTSSTNLGPWRTLFGEIDICSRHILTKTDGSCEGATEELSACDVQHITSKSGQESDVRCALSCIEAY